MTNAERQAKFRAAKKAQGFRQITVWVPEEMESPMSDLAYALETRDMKAIEDSLDRLEGILGI